MNSNPYIQIYKVNRGWFVRVGCQEIVFTNDEKEKMVEAFKDLIIEGELNAQEKWCGTPQLINNVTNTGPAPTSPNSILNIQAGNANIGT